LPGLQKNAGKSTERGKRETSNRGPESVVLGKSDRGREWGKNVEKKCWGR